MSVQEPTPDAIAPAAAAPPASNRAALFIVFLVVFIDLLGFGIVLPLLPRIADDYVKVALGLPAEAAPEGAAPEGMAGLIIGLLMASFSLMQFLFAPMWGRLSDRVGRRPILLVGLAGSVIFYALFGWALTLDPATQATLALTLFFVARSGAGIAGATIATAQAVIADSTPPEKRRHGMALIGAAFGIGFTFGPMLGFVALLTGYNSSIGFTAAGLSLFALVLGCILLPETRRFSEAPPVRRKWIDFSALRLVSTSAAIWPVIFTFFLATLGFAAFETTLALLLRDALGLEAKETLWMFAYVGFVLMFMQGYLYRKLANRYTETTFIAWGLIAMGGGVAILGLMTLLVTPGPPPASQWALFFLGSTASVVGYAFLTPSTNALISRRTDADRQGEILGVNQSASSLARILGPIAGLTLYKAMPSHILPYFFGAALLLLMLPLVPKIRRGDPAPLAA